MGEEYVLKVCAGEKPDNVIRSAATAFLVFLAIMVMYMAYQSYRFGGGMAHLLLFAPPFILYAIAFRKKPGPLPVIFSDRGISLGQSKPISWRDVKYYGLVAGKQASSSVLHLVCSEPSGKSGSSQAPGGLIKREINFETAAINDIERLFADRNISRREVAEGNLGLGQENQAS